MKLSKTERIIGVIVCFFSLLLFSVYILFGTVGLNESILLPSISISLIGIGGFCFFVFRGLQRRNQFQEIDYLTIGTLRYILGVFMIFYGTSKLFGNFFDYQLFALDSKLKDVSDFELVWYFFGKNNWMELFIGIFEFLPACFLFYRRTYYKAALFLLPATGEVFILNVFFKIGGITLPAAAILLAANIYIIYSQKEKIKTFFKSLEFSQELKFKRWWSLRIIRFFKGGAFVCVILVLVMNVQTLFKKPIDAKYDKLVGVYSLISMKKSHKLYAPAKGSTFYKDLYIEKQSRWNILRKYNDTLEAFILKLNKDNDSMKLYLNKGGIGDGPDIIDSSSVFIAQYSLAGDTLHIHGVQQGDTLELSYLKRKIKPKSWIW